MPTHDRSGLMCWKGRPEIMRRAHRHDDIEVNVALGGEIVYVLGGRIVTVPPDSTAVFWAAVPHQLLAVAPAAAVDWLTVPLGTVLGFGLAEQSVVRLLRGEPVIVAGADPDGLPEPWQHELAGPEPELHAAALTEVHAWLRRRLWSAREVPGSSRPPAPDAAETTFSRDVHTASAMARHIALEFREPLTVALVARQAGLSPGHAMTVFRRVVGSTIGSYLTQCRVAEAQRLLVTTRATVTDVAARSGFTSQSAFYDGFHALCEETPGSYRTRVRAARPSMADLPSGPGIGH